MDVKDFYYDLPQELIAQDPLEDRSSSRLMVLDKNTGEVTHRVFKDITDYLRPGDCLVINNTKVIPARLYGVKEGTEAKIEILLLKRKENDIWETLVKPGKKCKVGTKISFGDGLLTGEVIDIVEEGNRLIQFHYDGIFEEILDQLGQMPLPPYITHQLQDKNRYQTVYAKYDGSAAAPTAGLHFTPELLKKVKEMGVEIAEVTLHVGLGTFRPVKETDVLKHHMHSEFYRIEQSEALKNIPFLLYANHEFKEGNETVAYEIRAEGRTILLLGSLALAEEEPYPEHADLLILPYQGNNDLEREAAKIIERLQPRRILLSHFDNAFPPISRTVDISKFKKMMEERWPQIKVVKPTYGKTITLF